MTGIVLSCEHAAWALPDGVDLGVSADARRSQAGWDHGALDIAAALAEGLGAPLHAGSFTRMFVDLNRPADHPDVIPVNSYGAPVPANVGLSPEARAARLARHHAPYWSALRGDVDARAAAAGRVLHLSSHSFDPALDPAVRTFAVGVLFHPAQPWESAVAARLLAALRAAGFDARANQPYTGVGPAVCTSFRDALGGARYAGIQLETSHAVTALADGCARVAAALLPALRAL